ncbi:regulatory protein TetR [Anaeromyxobacter dehalogenans 2CP-1]|uniref:Regulatory protein TetR n=1 Tax=Anaeromyxobacter dehalogenans (strain ATCC BAA-258 / DSM 21875 / 2CP-1) TaxID=455488 RepID=B8J5P6_ANAD2|nr:TetR/AcrR family transcriptional regulator [Anaeromyxobacter dehalogenans]ACL64993.1 regulatory protein TetR [Anaeromyxobacter dehalogenans 2CP-1]
MARWEPDARGRLERAAMELYRERGYDQTTVAEIAARAGLTERTFFRHFADKREVLFWGAAGLQQLITDGIAGAPPHAAPLDAVAAALESTAPVFEQRRAFARQRQALIAAHPELQEREVMKLTLLAAAAAEALRARGVPEPAASLAAEAGIAVFKVAFEGWIRDEKGRGLPHHLRAALGELGAVLGRRPGSAAPTRAARPRRG